MAFFSYTEFLRSQALLGSSTENGYNFGYVARETLVRFLLSVPGHGGLKIRRLTNFLHVCFHNTRLDSAFTSLYCYQI